MSIITLTAGSYLYGDIIQPNALIILPVVHMVDLKRLPVGDHSETSGKTLPEIV